MIKKWLNYCLYFYPTEDCCAKYLCVYILNEDFEKRDSSTQKERLLSNIFFIAMHWMYWEVTIYAFHLPQTCFRNLTITAVVVGQLGQLKCDKPLSATECRALVFLGNSPVS